MHRIAIVVAVVLFVLGASIGPGLPTPADAAGVHAAPCPGAEARVVRNVTYVDDPASDLQRLDLYAPRRPNACIEVPVVVWVHGGGWATGSKRGTAATKATLFNDLGYLFVSVNYRLSAPIGDPGRPMHPDHADDVGAAVAWLEANAARYGGDGEQIALLGHSAGAHLVALVGLDPTYVSRAGGTAQAVRCVGSYDTASYDLVQRSAETRLVENAFGADEATLRAASPSSHVGDRADPPSIQIAARGAPSRRAAQGAFADSAESAGSAVFRIDALGLTHGDVNRLIGAPGDTRMTPPVTEFVTGCLGQSS